MSSTDKKPKLGYGRTLSRASVLPPIGVLAIIAGLGLGTLLLAHRLTKKS